MCSGTLPATGAKSCDNDGMCSWKSWALGIVLLGLGAEPVGAAPEAPLPASWKRSKTIDRSIEKRFCRSNGPTRYGIVVFKDRAGQIGGYQVSSSIMDSPVHYYDSQGAHLTMFHIFGPEAERAAANRVIAALRAEFPVNEPLRCPSR